MTPPNGPLKPDTARCKATTKGVTDAWDLWLSQHDITVPDCIEAAATAAVRGWLIDNTPELIKAIAEAVARNQAGLR
jgi:hypothetical protein